MKKLFAVAVIALACVACNGNKKSDTCTCDGTQCEEMGCKEGCTCQSCQDKTPATTCAQLPMGVWKGTLPQADAAAVIEATLTIKEGNKVDYTTTAGENILDADYTFADGKLSFADKSFELEENKLYMLDSEGKRANVEGAQEYIFTLAECAEKAPAAE